MKNEYKKPLVKMIDYAYQEQVVASSDQAGKWTDAIGDGRCTYNWPGCDLLYTTGSGCKVDVPSPPIP